MRSRTKLLRTMRLVAGLMLLVLATAQATRAATITVTNPNDSGPGSLRQAIADAASGDTINFGITGTITLTSGELAITKNLTISGPGAANLAISGNNASRVFYVNGGAVTISGLTVQNGRASASGGYPFIRGGGIFHEDHAHTLTLNNVIVQNNLAPSSLAIGGGIYTLGTMMLNNVTVNNNTSEGDGGGIVGRYVTMNGGTVSNNTATSSGGGIVGLGVTGLLTLNGVTVSNNKAKTNNAGGIYTLADATLTNVVISGNSAYISGGGIYSRRAGSVVVDVSLTDVTVSGNMAGTGGGINNYDARITLNRVTLSGNIAATGGGLYSGVIHADDTTTMTNVTISGNRASDGTGGGISTAASDGTLTLTNVSIIGNTGGGIYNAIVTTAKNTIVANNTPASENCTGTLTSQGNNLDSGNTCGFASAGDLVNTDPNVGPLRYQGAATQTHALLVGSPAIDAGTNTGCPATDQRGLWRPFDGNGDGSAICDIGAYEYIPPGAIRYLYLPLILR